MGRFETEGQALTRQLLTQVVPLVAGAAIVYEAVMPGNQLGPVGDMLRSAPGQFVHGVSYVFDAMSGIQDKIQNGDLFDWAEMIRAVR